MWFMKQAKPQELFQTKRFFQLFEVWKSGSWGLGNELNFGYGIVCHFLGGTL